VVAQVAADTVAVAARAAWLLSGRVYCPSAATMLTVATECHKVQQTAPTAKRLPRSVNFPDRQSTLLQVTAAAEAAHITVIDKDIRADLVVAQAI
jgi:hypothetical protein